MHFRAANIPANHICTQLGVDLCNTRDNKFQSWQLLTSKESLPGGPHGSSSLFTASTLGLIGIVEYLTVKTCIDVNEKDKFGYTILWRALSMGHYEIVKLLSRSSKRNIDEGGRLFYEWLNESPTFHRSKIRDYGGDKNDLQNQELILELIKVPSFKISASTERGFWFLAHAAKKGHYDIARAVFALPDTDTDHIDMGSRNDSSAQSIISMCRSQNIHMANEPRWYVAMRERYLHFEEYRNELRINPYKYYQLFQRCGYGKTPLFRLAEECHAAGVKWILRDGAKVDARDSIGRTPLVRVAWFGYMDIARILLDAGAIVDARDNWKRTPLYLAAQSGHTAMVQLLLDEGADITMRDHQGSSVLENAARNGRHALVQRFTPS
ncbi:hypothetical protein VTL71DRAFT_1719 [Oculimacula yallundae]|uniref:Ankyrin repeat protein n=1 Tax=Oculimacula yallundae TaxID=86028 RepID=A0ABR4CBI9_9HELO